MYVYTHIEAEAPRDVCARIQAWIYLPVFTHVFIYGRKHTHKYATRSISAFIYTHMYKNRYRYAHCIHAGMHVYVCVICIIYL